jgi:hypothetical protein
VGSLLRLCGRTVVIASHDVCECDIGGDEGDMNYDHVYMLLPSGIDFVVDRQITQQRDRWTHLQLAGHLRLRAFRLLENRVASIQDRLSSAEFLARTVFLFQLTQTSPQIDFRVHD